MKDNYLLKGTGLKHYAVKGNTKIGNVYHSSTTPGTENNGTCPFKCPGCYGFCGNYNFQSVKDLLSIRTDIARNDLELLYKVLSYEIELYGIENERIHVTGDFFSKEYVDLWETVVNEHPDVNFWTYTKTYGFYSPEFDKSLDRLNNHNNMNIVPSVIPGKGFNFGHCTYILKTYEYLKAQGEDVYICPCGTDKSVHCDSCLGCSKHKFVLFLEHSTGYKAEKDPLFNQVAAIVSNQK